MRSPRRPASARIGTTTYAPSASSACTGLALDADLEKKIKTNIRMGASPRHVPAEAIQVADIPRTKSGKIVELAVREVVHGRPVKNKEALANPEALELYAGLDALEGLRPGRRHFRWSGAPEIKAQASHITGTGRAWPYRRRARPRVAMLKAPMGFLVFGPFLPHYFCDASSFSVLYSHQIARPTNATEA